jgi:hypothetical protein
MPWAEREAMFEVVRHDEIEDAYVVCGKGGFAGQVAVFTGPKARERAEAYAQWLNSGAAFQRRRTDPVFIGRSNPERRAPNM